jgi:hypothetical protein
MMPYLEISLLIALRNFWVFCDIFIVQEQVFANLAAVLKTANSSFSQIVKTTVFLKDLNDFVAVNNVYAKVCPFLHSCIMHHASDSIHKCDFWRKTQKNERHG